MSGGSCDYAYYHIDYLADKIEARLEHPERDVDFVFYDRARREYMSEEESKPIRDRVIAARRKLVDVLRLAAKAAHDVEWVDSSDYLGGDELAAIEALLSFLGSER